MLTWGGQQLRNWNPCPNLTPSGHFYELDAGFLTHLAENPGLDWEYFTLTKQYKGIYMPNGFGQYELVILVRLIPSPSKCPDIQEGHPA